MSALIKLAAVFAQNAHESIDQRRKYSNEPYIVHPKSVAAIVATVTDDVPMICAAWLHDVVEDTPVTLEDVHREFGNEIAELVDDLTDVAKPEDGNRATRLAIDREHTKNASQRAKTVKLADVIDNLTGIVEADRGFAKKFVLEKQELLTVLTEGDSVLYQRAETLVLECKSELGLS